MKTRQEAREELTGLVLVFLDLRVMLTLAWGVATVILREGGEKTAANVLAYTGFAFFCGVLLWGLLRTVVAAFNGPDEDDDKALDACWRV